MIIYNVTIKISASIADEWLAWMQSEHIPEVIGTGCFTDARILRLLETDDSEGPTYTVQYHSESKTSYNRYIEKFADTLREKTFNRWGDNFIAFRTVMQIVN